ncbi:hypothetical protein SCP_0507640 [Sparassis crispa]|uniref:BTB domain-containing protein n=1 Tax=Sparassis crispa TaxID=139825 RepID=A0A401GNB4_9APHY|nr:hypothetical protein SCP_0507640 [Sparassis crispa]GBE83708.1 hypothetical protein SCP_0507640 [Sparassis crispa]
MAANTYTGTPSTSGAAVAASLTAQTRSGGTSEKRPAPATPADKSAKRPKLATPQSKPGPAVSSTATAAILPTSPKVLQKPDPVMSTSPSAVTHFKTEEKPQEAVPTASTPSLSDATCIKAEEPICPGTESTAFSSTSVPKSASNVEHTDAPPLTPASSSKPLPSVSVSDTTHRDVGHGGQNHTDVGPAASASASTSSTSALAFKHADCTRHSMFWQRDDFVVLRVQNTLFKLHRSRLEQESTFFADLFKRDTERPADRDTVDGCPVYLVDGTSAADFAVLMEAMDGGITYALNPLPFPALASLLRAAHALAFPRILNFASHVMRTTWAPDLACLTSVRTPNAAETIVLARTCNIPEVLKRAYYELLRSPGFHQSNDDIDDAIQRKAALEAAEYALLLAAREKLQEVWIQIASTPPDTSCPLISFSQPADAEPRRACEQAHAKGAELWAEMVGRAPVFKEGMLDPLGALENIIAAVAGAAKSSAMKKGAITKVPDGGAEPFPASPASRTRTGSSSASAAAGAASRTAQAQAGSAARTPEKRAALTEPDRISAKRRRLETSPSAGEQTLLDSEPLPFALSTVKVEQVSPKSGPAELTALSTASAPSSSAKFALCTRHPVFWHENPIVLLVQDTLFKLHRSRLEHESTYFADLFKRSSNPPLEGDVMDGCPVYAVNSVSAADFSVLMEAMDGGIMYALNPPPFPALASLLRAAHALGFPKILDFAKHVLRTMWPPDVAHVSSVRIPHAAETITLARTCGVPEVLKRAYYELLRSPGFKQTDDNHVDTCAKPSLGLAEYMRLVVTREKLQEMWIQIASAPEVLLCRLPFLPSPSDSDVERQRVCSQTRTKDVEVWAEMVVQVPLFKEGMLDPLDALSNLAALDWHARGFCLRCVNHWRRTWREELDGCLDLK